MNLIRTICLGAALTLSLLGCDKPDKGGTGPVVDPDPVVDLEPEAKGVLSGTLRLGNGQPAVNTTIRLYSVDHEPGNPANAAPKGSATQDFVFSARTDSLGRYSVDSVARGEYNLLGEKDGQVFYRDSIFLTPGRNTEVVDTLQVAGSITGTVALQPNHDLSNVIVHVLGTNVFSNVDERGRFTLRTLAGGRYSLKIEAGQGGYGLLYTGLTVRTGMMDTLAQALRLPFTGIPVVPGLKVVLDTLAGVARISWNKVDYRHFKSFVLLRSEQDAFDRSNQVIAVTRDTFFVDTLFPPETGEFGLANGIFSGPFNLEYKVRIRNLSEEEGNVYGSFPVNAVPPAWVQTHTEISLLGTDGNEASLNDTVKVLAMFHNKSRSLRKVIWRLDGEDVVRDVTLKEGTHSGSDTLTLVGTRLGGKRFHCQIVDDAGKPWTTTGTMAFVAAPPVALAGMDTTVGRGDTVRLLGIGTTRFGRIVKMEWDIGRTGAFQASADGSVEFTAPAGYAVVPCAFRVTNSDGETHTAISRVHVIRLWQKQATSLPMQGSLGQVVQWKGKMWFVGGEAGSSQGSLFSSLDGENWAEEQAKPGVTDRVNHAVFVFQDRLYIIGGNPRNSRNENHRDAWYTEDGISWNMEPKDVDGVRGSYATKVIPFQNQLWLFNEGEIWPSSDGSDYWSSTNGKEWNPWKMSPTLPVFDYRIGSSVIEYSGKLMVTGSGRPELAHSSDGQAWTRIGTSDLSIGKGSSSVVFNDTLWFIGGGGREVSTTVYADKDLAAFHSGTSFTEPVGAGNLSYVFAGKLWVIYNGTLWYLR